MCAEKKKCKGFHFQEPKGKKKVDPKTLSGYHPTSGPWDYDFYLPAPELLSITKKSDLWKAKKVVEMSELLSTLKVAKNVTAVRAALLSGPQSKDKAKKVKAAFAKATKALKDALEQPSDPTALDDLSPHGAKGSGAAAPRPR